MIRTPFRYYGGKGLLANWIVSFFPKHRIYVEPFCGAASVFFSKNRAYAEVLNDLNDDIVNVFRILRNTQMCKMLCEAIELTPYAMQEYHLAYSEPYPENAIERARRFLVRCAMGFYADSSNPHNPCPGFRGEACRKYSIPAHNWSRVPYKLGWFCERLQGCVIQHIDAINCITKYDTLDTLFYIDPPYVTETRTQASHHRYTHEMNNEDHRRLIELLLSVKSMVIISGYDHQIYEKLTSAGWQKEVKICHGKQECLWINPSAQMGKEENDGQ